MSNELKGVEERDFFKYNLHFGRKKTRSIISRMKTTIYKFYASQKDSSWHQICDFYYFL